MKGKAMTPGKTLAIVLGVFVGTLFAGFLPGVRGKAVHPASTTPSTAKPPMALEEKIKKLEHEVKSLQKENEALKDSVRFFKERCTELEGKAQVKDDGGSKVVFARLNHELDKLESGKGQVPWLDYFSPKIWQLRLSGADSRELNKLLDRARDLGKKGKFLSSWDRNHPGEFFADIEDLRPDYTSGK
jgi:hypothetical protein